jgi:hypothetical protein
MDFLSETLAIFNSRNLLKYFSVSVRISKNYENIQKEYFL